jgi:hypothetical protein
MSSSEPWRKAMKDEPHGNDIEHLRAIVEPTATDPYYDFRKGKAMTDIVERLRQRLSQEAIGCGNPPVIGYTGDGRLLGEAADEIERLRMVLQNIADTNIGTRVKPGETPDAASLRALRSIAREAV